MNGEPAISGQPLLKTGLPAACKQGPEAHDDGVSIRLQSGRAKTISMPQRGGNPTCVSLANSAIEGLSILLDAILICRIFSLEALSAASNLKFLRLLRTRRVCTPDTRHYYLWSPLIVLSVPAWEISGLPQAALPVDRGSRITRQALKDASFFMA